MVKTFKTLISTCKSKIIKFSNPVICDFVFLQSRPETANIASIPQFVKYLSSTDMCSLRQAYFGFACFDFACFDFAQHIAAHRSTSQYTTERRPSKGSGHGLGSALVFIIFHKIRSRTKNGIKKSRSKMSGFLLSNPL